MATTSGSSLGFEPLRTEYEAGQVVHLSVRLTNGGPKLTRVLTSTPFREAQLTIVTPGGGSFEFRPYRFKKMRPLTPEDFASVAPGKTISLFTLPVPVGPGEAPRDGAWVGGPGPLPFKAAGEHLVRVRHGDRQTIATVLVK